MWRLKDMMRITWNGEEEKEIVGLGIFKKGREVQVNDELAELLILQGLAKPAVISESDKSQPKEEKVKKNRREK